MKLKDYIHINPSVKLIKNEEYPFVEMKDIEPFNKIVLSKYTKKFSGSGSKFINGDTLLARITPCLENGKTSQFKSEINTPAWGSTEFIVLRAKKNLTDSDFVYYLSTFEEFRNYAIKNMIGTSGRQRVPSNLIGEFEYDLPDLPTQIMIAQILSNLDKKIEINKKLNSKLEETAFTLFKSWFINFDPVQEKTTKRSTGLSKEIEDLFPDTFENSKLGKIPKGWSVSKIGEIFEIQKGSTPSTKEKKFWEPGIYDWVSPKDLSRSNSIYITGYSRKISDEGVKKIKSKLCPSGTVLMSSRAPIGYLGISTSVTSLGTGIFAVLNNKYTSSGFIYFLIKNEIKKLKQLSIGTTFEEISKKIFEDFEIIYPNKEVLNGTKNIFDNFFKKIKLNTLEIETLIEIRNFILPKMMKGELKILSSKNRN